MSTEKFIKDGEAQVKEAEKSLKTGITKWNADYDLAAGAYVKAATAFKNAKDFTRSLDCWMKAADCHLKNKVPFHAAKAYEQAAFATRDGGDLKKVAELINKAYLLYVENGVQDSAGTLLDRGGKILEEQMPEEAAKLYRKAADVAQIQDKPSQASEMFDRSARLLVRLEKYEEAVKVLEDLVQNEMQSPSPPARRYVLCLVLVQLKRDDYVAAKKAYETGMTFPDPLNAGQLNLAASLLDAYDTCDRAALKAVTSNAYVRSLDPVYARLARSLDVPDSDLGDFSPAVVAAPVKETKPTQQNAPPQNNAPARDPSINEDQSPTFARESPGVTEELSNNRQVTQEDEEEDLT